jgi:hypothetical protein
LGAALGHEPDATGGHQCRRGQEAYCRGVSGGPEIADRLNFWFLRRTLGCCPAWSTRTCTCWVRTISTTAARELSRAVNVFGAGLRETHPGRFGHFASLPLPDVEGALVEAVHALDPGLLGGL